MLKKFLNQIDQNFKNMEWHPRRPYDQMLLDAKEAGYLFDLYVESNLVTFQADDIELLNNRIVFKKDQEAISIRYFNIRKLRPLFRDKRIEIICSKPINLILFIIPFFLILSGAISLWLSENGGHKAINHLLISPSIRYDLEHLIGTYDNDLGGASYYYGPSADELRSVLEPLLIEYAFRGFAQALFISGVLLSMWLFLLFIYTRKADRNILIAEKSIHVFSKRITQPEEKTTAYPNKSRLELFIEFLRLSVWPTLVVILLFIFWQPIYGVANQLPTMAERAKTIRIGDVIVDMRDNPKISSIPVSDEVRQVLLSLSPNDVSSLLALKKSSSCYFQESVLHAKTEFAGLISLGLVEEVSYGSKDFPSDSQCVYTIKASALGLETQDYISKIVAEFVRQLNPPVPTPTAPVPTLSILP